MAEFEELTTRISPTGGIVDVEIISGYELNYAFVEFSVPPLLSSAPASSYFSYSFTLYYNQGWGFNVIPYTTINTLQQALSITKDSSNHLSIDVDLEHSQAGANLGGVVANIIQIPTQHPYIYAINLTDPRTRYDYDTDTTTARPYKVIMHLYPSANNPPVNVVFSSTEPEDVNPLSALEALTPVPALIMNMDIGTYKLSYAFAIVLIMSLAVTLVRLLR